MSKALTAAGVGLGSAGIAAGGIYLYGMFNVEHELPSKLEDWEEIKGGHCVGSIFPGIDNIKPSGLQAVTSGDVSFTGGTGDGNTQDSRSCLVVN